MNQLNAVVFVLSVFASRISSYPTNVPEAACYSMLPGHGEAPQTSPSPFSVEVSPSVVRQGDVVQVILSGTQNFKGFYVQARTPEGLPIGTFIRSDFVGTHNCNNQKSNAAFHKKRGYKKDQEIFWKAPSDFEGQITFYATFVAEFDKIWTFVRGNSITVKLNKRKRKLRACRSTSSKSVFAKLESTPKNHTLEIVPRIMNRKPESEYEQKRRFPALSTTKVSASRQFSSSPRREHQEFAATFPSFTKYFTNANSVIQGMADPANYYPTHGVTSPNSVSYAQNSRPQNADFHFSQGDTPSSSLFPMQINRNALKSPHGINYHLRHENKIAHQRQPSPSTFPYKLEYNGNGHQPQVTTFTMPTSYHSVGSGASPMKVRGARVSSVPAYSGAAVAGGEQGKRSTVWIMDDRFQHFKDVEDLAPVARPVQAYYSQGQELTNPIVDLGSTQLQNPYASLHSSYVSSGSPVQGGSFGSAGQDHLQRFTNQFPTHGYLVPNLKGNPSTLGNEPPFYLIPASKHDVDNFNGQYFTNLRRNQVIAAGYSPHG